jgi:alpha-glucosidase
MLKILTLMIFSLNLMLWSYCDFLNPTNKSKVSSPNGKINIEVIVQNGILYYKILYEKEVVVNLSKLGFLFKNDESMNKNFEITGTSSKSVDEDWKPVYGPSNIVKNHFNELQIKLIEDTLLNREMYLDFRVYNDGVGFRYIFPEQSNLTEFEITSEETQYNFSDDHTVWWIPADYDSYEHLYSRNLLSEIKAVNTPVTMATKNGLYLSIHEADLTDYAGMTLKSIDGESLALECDLVPWPDGVKVKASTPHRTPWRTIQIATKPGDLIESHLIENLNNPCQIKDVSWIKPMKYVGIWWGMHIGTESWQQGPYHGATTKNAKRYIDFAAENNIPGLLIEGWNTGWESWGKEDAFNFQTAYDDFDLQEVARYAKEKNVNLIGHHETGGQVENYEKNLSAAFELCQQLGITAVKTGYAGTIRPKGQYHHGQWMINHYRNVVKKAAEYKIMLDVHEPIKPTGIRRTYPNMMTREGVQGMEYNAWSDGNPPEHTTIIPFTRMLAGPLDYTPGIFDIELNLYKNFRKKIKLRDNLQRRVHTTISKQLALYVVLYSPLQMAADFPENYKDHPAFNFIKNVPVTWDETKVLDAKIGDYVIIARRNKEDWFVGAITDENSRNLKIPLTFLKSGIRYVVHIYSDGKKSDWEKNPTEIEYSDHMVEDGDFLPVVLAKGGGMALHFSSVSNEKVK